MEETQFYEVKDLGDNVSITPLSNDANSELMILRSLYMSIHPALVRSSKENGLKESLSLFQRMEDSFCDTLDHNEHVFNKDAVVFTVSALDGLFNKKVSNNIKVKESLKKKYINEAVPRRGVEVLKSGLISLIS